MVMDLCGGYYEAITKNMNLSVILFNNYSSSPNGLWVKIPHGKTEKLPAKTKSSRQNQILHSKNQIPYGKSKYPRQNQSYSFFAVKYLV